MAKDPAFLFYSTDFYMGTVEMSDEQVGQYIRLMCLQHQKGHLSKQIMLSTMRGHFDELIMSKFILDENGCYYNARLEAEIKKRQRFTSSRTRNLKGTQEGVADNEHSSPHTNTHMETHMGIHMETHMVNENENENENENVITNEVVNEVVDEDSPQPKKGKRHKHGTYGWVQLTDQEYQKLLLDLGEAELKRCIEYVDESAQSNGNKNKWKDWNLVIRKCSRQRWGLNQPYREGGASNGQGFRPSKGFRQAGDDK